MWGNPALFNRAKSIEKRLRKDNIGISFLIDSLTANNAIYRDSLTLKTKRTMNAKFSGNPNKMPYKLRLVRYNHK